MNDDQKPGNDGYQAVEGKASETIAANPFVAGAYGVIWGAVLIFVVIVARGLKNTRAELAEAKRKLDKLNAA